MINYQKQILKDVFALFSKEDILSEKMYMYEEFNIVNRYRHIQDLAKNNIISKQAEQAVLVTMAIMYVNMCMLYAQSHLSHEEFQKFLVLFTLDDCNEEEDFAWTEILYTNQSDKIQFVKESDKIEFQDCKYYEQIKEVEGLSDFDCYFVVYDDFFRRYCFVPKCYRSSMI